MSSKKNKTAVIAKGNNLIMSHYSFELSDAKMVFLGQLKLREKFGSETGGIITIPQDAVMRVKMSREEIIEFLGWQKSHSFYEDLRDVGDRLTSQRIEFYEETVDKNGEIKRHFEFIDPYPYAKYKDGCFELEFSSAIRNELGNFEKGNFTLLDKQSIKNISHTNALRLYEIFKAHAYRGGITISLDELRKKMFIDAEQKEGSKYKETRKYSAFGEFNRSVLKPCIKEINEVTDIDVSYVSHREGRLVTELEFVVTPKSERVVMTVGEDGKEEYKKAKKLSDEDSRKVKFLRRIIIDENFSDLDLYELLMLANWDNETICSQYDLMCDQIDKGIEINSKVAWMREAVRNDYAKSGIVTDAVTKPAPKKRASSAETPLETKTTSEKTKRKTKNQFTDYPQRDNSKEFYADLEERKLGLK